MTRAIRSFTLATLPIAAMVSVCVLGAPSARADDDSATSQAGSSGAAELAALKAQARALREAGAKAPGPLDKAAPLLHSIATSGSVNAQSADQSITVDLDIRDDLSGIASYYIEYQSPSGRQHVWRAKTVSSPLLHVTPTLTLGSQPFSEPGFSVFDQPGTWTADYFYVFDAAGNENEFSANTLANIGSVSFNVSNNGGYDSTPPTLANGTVDTPNVRRSKGPRGTKPGTPPWVSADISITDAGESVISGTAGATLTFCHSNGCGTDTLVLPGTVNQAGIVANTMTVGTQIRTDQTLGQYIMCSLDLNDVAGNPSTLATSTCGGSTNFSTYFPKGTTIFVNQ